MIHLLDVNVLISLLDSAHVHHAPAVKWFSAVASSQGWATTPTTENGFVRIVSQVSYPNLRLTPAMASTSLALFKQSFPGIHHFWPDDVSLNDRAVYDLSILTGSRQITDTYLAGLAHRNGGRLATLDNGIAWRSVRNGSAELIENIPT